MEPIITIVIPTLNRQKYAAILVQSVLELIPNCQVVVNDNSDNDSLREMLCDSLSDPRLSYKYFKQVMSVVENFNSALERAQGRYICFLGDDDMIGPRFLSYVEWAEKNKIEAILYRNKGRVIHYFWPGVSSPRWGDLGGKLFFSDFSGEITPSAIPRAIKDAINHLGSGPRNMPRIYLGIVSRELIWRVQECYGLLFGGFSPDIYSSHLLSTCCGKAAVVDFPFIIPGASPKSTSAARAERSDVGGLTTNDHIGRFTQVDWDKRIPMYYSPNSVWAQSHLMALVKTEMKPPIRAFAYLYATLLVFTPKQAVRFVPTAIIAHLGVWRRLLVSTTTLLYLLPVAVAYAFSKIPTFLVGKPGAARHSIVGLADTRGALDHLSVLMEPPESLSS
ncbi:MAG: hypothetical protein A2Z96_08010 [Spirochaetes bacterium GWB1_48_6]|nr:MAG: hypothetical protein A2Z96_08010 [Spirochaetes bacterium GWB1_48_6]